MDKQQLVSLVDQGKTQRTIALNLGVSQSTVKHWLKKYDIKTKHLRGRAPAEGFKCKFCGENDPSKFMKHDKDHLSKSRCKSCHSKYTIDRFRGHKLKAIEYKGGQCSRCGYNKCAGSLHFHHEDPGQKDPNWRLMRNWKFDKILEELDKCSLVCANCHGEIHWGKETNVA